MLHPRRLLIALLALVAPLAAACGDDEPERSFCEILRDSVEMNVTAFDPSQPRAPEETLEALDDLGAVAPPELVEPMATLTTAFEDIVEALRDYEDDPSQLTELDLDAEAITAAQVEVYRYSFQACSINLDALPSPEITPPTLLPPPTAPPDTAVPDTTPPETTAPTPDTAVPETLPG